VTETQPQYWFHAKRWGWGWGLPARWQGWVALGAYATVVLAPLAFGEDGAIVSIGAMIVATPIFVYVCYRKGEPPHWRWGNK
jgi:hypothetical protein